MFQLCSNTSRNTVSSSNFESSGDNAPLYNIDPDPTTNVSKRCCPRQYQIYENGMVLNEHRRMTKIMTEEHIFLMRNLHNVPSIEELF